MRARESSVCKTLSLQISSQEHAGAKERKTSVTNLRYHEELNIGEKTSDMKPSKRNNTVAITI